MRSRYLTLFLALQLTFGIDVTTHGYDNARSQANTSETVLSRAFVASSSFGFLGKYVVDGAVYTPPLIHNRQVFIATMHGSIYSFDEAYPSSYRWRTHLADPFPAPQPAWHEFPNGEVGCLPTPVINSTLGVIYALCLNDSQVWKLYSLNVSDGSTYNAAVTISASASGSSFDSELQKARAALLLVNGNVHVAFASVGNDDEPFQGWLIAYNAVTLNQSHVWCATCGGSYEGGGIWMSGGGISADSAGNICVVTGNGDWNGTTQFGESFVKLSPSLSVLDFFTPTNWATLNAADTDLGTSRCLLISDSYAVSGGKDGRIWLLNTANMGHLQSDGVGPVQVWTGSTNFRNYFVFANNTLFVGSSGENSSGSTFPFKSFAWGGSSFNTTETATSVVVSAYGLGMSYSSNGASDGILWVTTATNSAFNTLRAGTLRALRADTLAEIWNSGATLGNLAKFVPPVVANGKVFAASMSNSVAVYGTIPAVSMDNAVIRGNGVIRGN